MESKQKHTGQIELVIGPMFSEKTTELISRIRRAALADQAVILIKYEDDCRYDEGDVVTTHSGICQETTGENEKHAPIKVVRAKTLSSVEGSLADSVVVGIDEGQFYPDLVEYCERWAVEGRRVVVAALDGDFARRPFGQVCDLIPLCESVEKRSGVCMMCRKNSSAFTLRITNSTALVEIGADESYRTVCRRCHAAGKGAT